MSFIYSVVTNTLIVTRSADELKPGFRFNTPLVAVRRSAASVNHVSALFVGGAVRNVRLNHNKLVT